MTTADEGDVIRRTRYLETDARPVTVHTTVPLSAAALI